MKLAKYLALMVLAVFLVSTVAFAEETGTNSDANKETVKPISKDKREDIRDKREDVRDKREDIRDKREDVRDKLNIDRAACIKKCQEAGGKVNCEAKCKVLDKREDIRDKREDIRDKREDVRERLREFNVVKERFKLAENKLKLEKIKFVDVRDRFKKECAADSNKNICKTIKSEIKTNAKPHLINIANAVLEALNRLRARTESSDYLEDADKNEILANIDAKIANVKELIAKIEALNKNSTPEEIKQVAEDIKVAWKDLKPFLELQGKKVGIIRIGGIIKKSEKLDEKLHKVLERLESKGFDVSNVDALVTEFDNHIKEAKASHVEALKLISASDIKGAHEKLTEAKKHLKFAHEVLKKIVQEIKNRDKIALETPEPEETTAIEEQTTIATQ